MSPIPQLGGYSTIGSTSPHLAEWEERHLAFKMPAGQAEVTMVTVPVAMVTVSVPMETPALCHKLWSFDHVTRDRLMRTPSFPYYCVPPADRNLRKQGHYNRHDGEFSVVGKCLRRKRTTTQVSECKVLRSQRLRLTTYKGKIVRCRNRFLKPPPKKKFWYVTEVYNMKMSWKMGEKWIKNQYSIENFACKF